MREKRTKVGWSLTKRRFPRDFPRKRRGFKRLTYSWERISPVLERKMAGFQELREASNLPADTFRRHLNFFMDISRITKVKRDLYALSGRIPLDYQVIEAIDDLRLLLGSEPSLELIAIRVGKPPEEVRSTVYKVAESVGWHEPTDEERRSWSFNAMQVLRLAACLKYDPRRDPNY